MSDYSHLQFSGSIPNDIAAEAFGLLKRGMDQRPPNCGGFLRLRPRPYNDSGDGEISVELDAMIEHIEQEVAE